GPLLAFSPPRPRGRRPAPADPPPPRRDGRRISRPARRALSDRAILRHRDRARRPPIAAGIRDAAGRNMRPASIAIAALFVCAAGAFACTSASVGVATLAPGSLATGLVG